MLEPLLSDIPAAHLAQFNQLFVRLNTPPCICRGPSSTEVQWDCSNCAWYRWRGIIARPFGHMHMPIGTIQEPCLRAHDKKTLQVLKPWESVCRRLGSILPPKQLRLTVVCAVDDDDEDSLASRLLNPMVKHLPLLRSCTIRLGRRSKNEKLKGLARKTAHRLMWGQQPFRFNHLPKELRLHVLQYTRLGTAYSDVNSTPEKGLHIVGDKLVFRPQHFTRCCGNCSFYYREVCCCSTNHASYASDCTCAGLPTALFRVSHEMRYDALNTLLRYNSPLVISNSPECLKSLIQAPTLVPVLRQLTLVGPAEIPQDLTAQGDSTTNSVAKLWKVWKEEFVKMLSLLAHHPDLSVLNLEFDMRPLRNVMHYWLHNARAADEEMFYWIYHIYLKVVEVACTSLRGVGSVKFHLGIFSDLAPWLEREVLGERFVGSVDRPAEKGPAKLLLEACPRFHQMSFTVRGPNGSKGRKMGWPGQSKCARFYTRTLSPA
ncbi:hypothetical protein BD289DRAFT_437182 [Coniella lustricola]|uniref:Uncharacterized protein n=1 Tax=Coniella lustricola TaxID=2025994 RepID=A0A2T3A4A3_9PEZI|nr:hypothetical protein BD289DRAFT_437182 [Coniella lustricola]